MKHGANRARCFIAVNSTVLYSCRMARDDPQVNIRMPERVKSALEEAARDNGRSLTAEIVHRLQETLEMDDYVPVQNAHPDERPITLSRDELKAMLYEAAALALAPTKKKPDPPKG